MQLAQLFFVDRVRRLREQHREQVLGRIHQVSGHNRHFCFHHEEEFLFVLKGSLEFLCKTPEGLVREELRRGDCITFRSDMPHSLSSLEPEPADTIHVLASESAPVETAPVALALETSPEAPQLEFAPETMPVQDRLNLAVIGTGVRMPPPLFAYLPPVPPAPVIVPPVAPPVVVPPAPPPPMYVPPVLPPKPDRG